MKNDPVQDLLDVAHVFQTFEERRGCDIDPDLSADVRVPVPRRPTLPDSAIALSEPDDDEPTLFLVAQCQNVLWRERSR